MGAPLTSVAWLAERRADRQTRDHRLLASAPVRLALAPAFPPPWCANTRPTQLRGLAVVELEQSAEPLTTCDWAGADHGCRGRDEVIAQTLVRPFFMIMIHIRADRRSEVPFAEAHYSVQAFALGGLDKPVGERVQIRTPRGEDQWLYATVAQQMPKGRRLARISVEDDVLRAAESRRPDRSGSGRSASSARRPARM